MPLRHLDVLADQPFAEIGDPTLVVDDPAYDFLVVAGDLPYSPWFGAGAASRTHARLGVHGRTDLVCRQVETLRRPVNDVAIHPSGALAPGEDADGTTPDVAVVGADRDASWWSTVAFHDGAAWTDDVTQVPEPTIPRSAFDDAVGGAVHVAARRPVTRDRRVVWPRLTRTTARGRGPRPRRTTEAT